MREATIPVRPPYRLDLTANALRRLSTNVVDVFDGTTYRRLLGGSGRSVLLEVTQADAASLSVRLHGAAAGRLDPAALVRRILGTDVDLERFYRSCADIPWLFDLAERARGVKPPRYPSLWETIVNAVVYQQVSIHAASAILRRVIECYERPRRGGDAAIYPFPAPRTIAGADPTELRGLGLSVNKAVALRTLAGAVIDGTLDEAVLEALPTPDLVARLERHQGIGAWTAAVIALRGFGRLDVFPMKDSGVARSLRALSGENDVDAEAILRRLGPERGMLYYHLLLGRLAARGEVELAATGVGS